MAELTREELIEKKAFSAPLELADNFSKLHKEILSVIDTGKKLNSVFGSAKGLKDISKAVSDLAKNQANLDKANKELVKSQDQRRKVNKDVNNINKEAIKLEAQLGKLSGEQAKENAILAERVKERRKEVQKAAKDSLGLTKEVKKLSAEEKALEKIEKSLTDANAKNNREYIKKAAELKKVQQQTRDSIKTEGQLSNTYDSQSTRLKNLRKEYKDAVLIKGQDAKETQQLAKRVQILDKRLKEVDASAGEFNREVGNYKNKVQEAIEETSVFGVNIGDLLGNFKKLINPLTAAVGVVGALGAAYLSTGRGARDLARANDSLNASINSFSQSIADLLGGGSNEGMGLLEKTLFGLQHRIFGLTAATKGLREANLFEKLRELEIEEQLANEINKRLLNEAEIQRQIRDEERNSISERYDANTKLGEIINEREQKQLDIFEKQRETVNEILKNRVSSEEKEILEAMTDQEEISRRLISNRNADIELRQKLASLNAEIADIEEDSQGQRSEAMANDLALFREMNEEQLRITTARINEQILLAEEGSRKEMELKLALVNAQEQVLLEAAGENEQRRTAVIQEAVNQRLQIYRDYQSKITQLEKIGFTTFKETEKEKTKTFIEQKEEEMQAIAARYRKERDEAKRAADEVKRLEDEKAAKRADNIFFAEELGNNFFQVQRNNINAELELLRNANEEKLQIEGLTEEGRLLIQKNFAEQEKRLRQEQARLDRRQAIFNILTNTAVGISSLLPGFPATLPLIIKAGLIGAAQIAAVPPVPKFAKGTKSSPEGYAIVNDGGGAELLERNGKYSMVESDGAALTYLKQGTRVHTAEETQELLAKGAVKNVAINDRQATNPYDAKIYEELKRLNKSSGQQRPSNLFLDGKPIARNINKRNAIVAKTKSMNRY